MFNPCIILQNTRTRKWRPAIERAFDLRRPAALLLEDGLNIYEGKGVRRLASWDGDSFFAFDPKYLTVLRTWPKSKRVKVKKVKATKRSATRRKKTEASLSPAGFGNMAEAPLDLSPCAAFANAGGQMMIDDIHDDNDIITAGGNIGGEFAAI